MALNNIIVKHLKGKEWEVVRPFHYHSQILKQKIIVPPKFLTDFGTIPRFFWRIFPPTGELYDEATVVHDWLYETQFFTRKEADLIFHECMVSYGVPPWKAYILYLAVRIGGNSAWKAKTSDSITYHRHLLYTHTGSVKDMHSVMRSRNKE